MQRTQRVDDDSSEEPQADPALEGARNDTSGIKKGPPLAPLLMEEPDRLDEASQLRRALSCTGEGARPA